MIRKIRDLVAGLRVVFAIDVLSNPHFTTKRTAARRMQKMLRYTA